MSIISIFKAMMDSEETERKKRRMPDSGLLEEPLLGSKRLKVEPANKEDFPMVMQGDTIYIFITGCSKQILKVIRDICDPISKPQQVHEYRITPESLLRAQALGYSKA